MSVNRFSVVIFVLTITFSCQAFSTALSATRAQLTLVGEATFSVFFWDIYHSKLYTQTGKYLPQNEQTTLFEIHYLKDITGKDLIERTVEQWQHLAIDTSHYQHYIELLSSIWPDIKAGDQLSLLIKPQQSDFYFNGHAIGSINSAEFGPLFLAIWVSEYTSQPNLRAHLLGEK